MNEGGHSKSERTKPLLVIVTGLSGAGRSSAVGALEDLGFVSIDSLPIEMFSSSISYMQQLCSSGQKLFAVGMEVRVADFDRQIRKYRKQYESHFDFDHLHLTCDEEVIAMRYGATRRKHPQIKADGQLLSAIARERELLSLVEERADMTLDTSHWSPHQLARAIEGRYSQEVNGRQLHVSITSFGFKHGMLRPADSMSDVRFLTNPHFVPELRNLSGLDDAVKNYVKRAPEFDQYMAKLKDLYGFLLPQYYNEGKHYFRIGIGCTGGQHRSVTVAEELARDLQKMAIPNVTITVTHRDI